MDMLRRRSEPGLSSAANEAEENRGDGGEERQQVVQALTDGREVATIQPTSQVENEVVPVQAANPFWSERAQEEMRLRQSRPASLPASGGDRSGENTRRPPSLQDLLGQEPAPVERPSSGLMGQMERGTIGGAQVEEELIPDVGGEEQSEDMAVVKRALKELLVQTKELGNRLPGGGEKLYLCCIWVSFESTEHWSGGRKRCISFGNDSRETVPARTSFLH